MADKPVLIIKGQKVRTGNKEFTVAENYPQVTPGMMIRVENGRAKNRGTWLLLESGSKIQINEDWTPLFSS